MPLLVAAAFDCTGWSPIMWPAQRAKAAAAATAAEAVLGCIMELLLMRGVAGGPGVLAGEPGRPRRHLAATAGARPGSGRAPTEAVRSSVGVLQQPLMCGGQQRGVRGVQLGAGGAHGAVQLLEAVERPPAGVRGVAGRLGR